MRFILTFLFTGCTIGTVDDVDGDGFSVGIDCDDMSTHVHPEAIEICDGVDNNCDGVVDEGVALTLFADRDGDRWGDPLESVTGCLETTDWVITAGDCDDHSASTHPDATEICDLADNDCDEEVDEGLAVDWYPDIDADGFGNPQAAATWRCSTPSWSTRDHTDCGTDQIGGF